MVAAKQHIPIVKKRMFPITCPIPFARALDTIAFRSSTK
jgi:hypothetical protein